VTRAPHAEPITAAARTPEEDDQERDARPAPPRRRGRRRRIVVVVLALVVVLGAVAPRVTTWAVVRGDVVHSASQLPELAGGEHRAAIVLGAGLVGEEPSPLLRERIEGAIDLFEAGRVDLLVMSGDNSTQYYDEPTVMRTYAIRHGVPADRVAADYAGRRTWDSCARAKRVFGMDEAVVVTNAFHVDRAVLTCSAAGIDATGLSVSDSGHHPLNRAKWRLRELAASGRALVDAWIVRPEPAVGGDRIDPWDPCQLRDSLAPSDAERSADEFERAGCA
jgi:vancomycin permeability regulator SanA